MNPIELARNFLENKTGLPADTFDKGFAKIKQRDEWPEGYKKKWENFAEAYKKIIVLAQVDLMKKTDHGRSLLEDEFKNSPTLEADLQSDAEFVDKVLKETKEFLQKEAGSDIPSLLQDQDQNSAPAQSGTTIKN